MNDRHARFSEFQNCYSECSNCSEDVSSALSPHRLKTARAVRHDRRSQRTSQTHIKVRIHASFHSCINPHCHFLHIPQYALRCWYHPPDRRHFGQTSFENSDRRLLSPCYADARKPQGLRRSPSVYSSARLTLSWMPPAKCCTVSNLITADSLPPYLRHITRVGGHDRREKPEFASLLRSDMFPTRWCRMCHRVGSGDSSFLGGILNLNPSSRWGK